MDILIVGYGIVGHNLEKELITLHPDIYDKYKTEYNTKRDIHYQFCCICVDTPYTEAAACDISQVQDALTSNDADYYIIKSAILPGTATSLSNIYHKHIVVSPEYYGATQHCNNYNFNFTILGGEKQDCIAVQQMLQHIYDASHTFHIVDATTAELVKYMENSYLGMKVAFCAQFFEIAKSLGVNYEDVRELFILDPRVNPSHTFVYNDHPYYDSHCLNKDILALAETADASLLKSLINFNNEQKTKYGKGG